MADDANPPVVTDAKPPLSGKRALLSLLGVFIGLWIKNHTHLDATTSATVVDLVVPYLADGLTYGGLALAAYFKIRTGLPAIPTKDAPLFAPPPGK